MQLSAPPTPPPDATDVATALRAATDTLGHRPAITVFSARGREEQGVASLAQWAAKGAHLLELDLLLGPGDRLRLDAPLSWPSAAVCLAAWWAGVAVTLDGDTDGDTDGGADGDSGGDSGGADVAVVHESRPRPPGAAEVLWLGDAIDGAPLGEVSGEPWVRAVQTFPDQPPQPRASADAVALSWQGRTWTQRDLLAQARRDPDGSMAAGTLGIDLDGGPLTQTGSSGAEKDATAEPAPRSVDALTAVALRPLVVGRPTVVLHGVDRSLAAGERVARWA